MSAKGDQPSAKTSKGTGLAKGVPPSLPLTINSSVSPGMGILAGRTEVFVKQTKIAKAGKDGCEVKTRYSVLDVTGLEIYSGVERTNYCMRKVLGKTRAFKIVLQDPEEQPITIERGLRGSSCWCPYCLQKLKVYNFTGEVLGSVRQRWTWWKLKLEVLNPDGVVLYVIKGPRCTSRCCGTANFKIEGPDESEPLGLISKYWNGMMKEIFPEHDDLGINFPDDVEVGTKAVLLGAGILIDFMYYKRTAAIVAPAEAISSNSPTV